MRLLEFLDQQALATAYYDPSQDQVGRRVPNDTRKSRLFLRHLNRLKRVRALNKLEASGLIEELKEQIRQKLTGDAVNADIVPRVKAAAVKIDESYFQ